MDQASSDAARTSRRFKPRTGAHAAATKKRLTTWPLASHQAKKALTM
ncbi:hypothetical protein [Halomonas sp. YLGW01]|nr:hypothetical protein [Halomonas sp. YLGW01]